MKVTKVSITVHQFHKSKGKGNKSLNIRIDYKNVISFAYDFKTYKSTT